MTWAPITHDQRNNGLIGECRNWFFVHDEESSILKTFYFGMCTCVNIVLILCKVLSHELLLGYGRLNFGIFPKSTM